MQHGLDAMRAALRVLTSVTERQTPANEDLELLRAYVPEASNYGPDELACEVIQRALRKRSEVRAARA
jgi:hypothetical protein